MNSVMKKILMLSAFALAGLAAAQDTTTPAPTETAPATTETAPATTETTPATDTVTTTEAAPEMTTMTMTPADAFARAQEYAVQADVAYPVPFYDRTLWKAAVDASYVAASQDTDNRAYDAYLAHMAAHHPDQPVLDRIAFFRNREAARYAGKGGGKCC